MTVSVVEPVTAVDLTVSGKPTPGSKMTVKPVLTPQSAGNKALEYSLNVGEDIATIDAKGQLKIAKTAPAGTVITVTCKALGAPEPVVATLEIIVT